nr:two-component regulator propeller domain-containing protein [Gaetbulibacter sp. 4G1]
MVNKQILLNNLLRFLLVLPFVLFSQNDKLLFEEFVIEDGLASVNCILKDKNGFMWFGGTHGLYRYDGYKFKAFNSNKNDTYSLSNNNITCLFEDHDGFLWVGTMQGGLNKYNPFNDSFTNYKNKKNNSTYSTNHITSIAEDQHHTIWVGTFGEGLYTLNKNTGAQKKFNQDIHDSNTVSDDNIFSIAIERENVWITSNAGILDCFNINTQKFSHYKYNDTDYHSTRTGQRICFDSYNNLWIGTEGNGVYRFNIHSKIFEHFKKENNKSSINSNEITDIKEGKPGEIWITSYGGLNLLNTNTNEVQVYKNDAFNKYSITNNVSYCLFIDNNTSLWMGMGDGTVNKTKHSSFELYQTSILKEPSSLSFNVVTSLFMSDNALWVGTGGGGLDKLDLKTDSFFNFKENQKNNTSIPSNIVMNVIEDKNKNIWIGGFNRSIIGYKEENSNVFKEAEFNKANIPNVINNLVFDLVEDNLNNIWIATYNEGLYKYDKTSKTFTNYKVEDGLISNNLLCLLYDSTGKLWIGSLNKGFQVFDTKKNKFLNPSEAGINNDTKINYPIKAIFEDTLKSIWFATEGDGVYQFKTFKKQFSRLNIEQGLPSNSIYGIIQDNANNIWFSTNRGIATFNPVSKKILTYNTFDGLPTNDFESGAIAKAKDGKLFFGSKKGLIAFYPSLLNTQSAPINLMLTNFRLFNEDIEANEAIESYTPLDSSIVFTKNIKLPYFLNNFTFEFATPGYPSPHNIRYEYKLEGLDDRWITTPSEHHFANYSNISSGSYTFKVRATEENSVDTNNFSEKHIQILITPVWWQTNIAYLVYILILTSLIYFIFYSVKNRIRLKNELVIEKYKHEKDEELHQSKINFFTTISHELRTSLTLILGPLQELKKIKSTNNRTNNLVMTMNRNGQRLLSLVTQILDFRKMESGMVKLKISITNIKEFFNELCIPFYQYAQEKNIHFQLTVSNSCDQGWFDANKLEVILYNILSNAFKFTNSKVDINVDLDEKDEKLIIKIKDNGHGLSPEEISKIFKDFYQVNTENTKAITGTGIGLAITKNLVQIHYGEILVKSEPNEYTIFNVIIPITRAFYNNNEIVDSLHETPLVEEIFDEKIILEADTPKNDKEDKPILLVVEDNFEIRDHIKNNLSDHYKVITATNGAEGCQKAFEIIPDVIISDIMMPEMNGLELCKKIKLDNRTSHIPIILLTARGAHALKMEGFEYGADDYITKPFNIDVLNIRVMNLIENRRILRDIFRKEILLKPKDVAINNVDEIFIEKVMKIIEENMPDPKFSVSLMASNIGMSHSVLYRKIMALTGQNINEFIKSVKLARASQLILDSDYSINEISDMTGFSNSKYFSTCFKKKYNVTPSSYKKNQA